MSLSKFINSSLILFIDQLVTAVGGWLFWLIFSGLITSSEIGETTTVYSLIVLIVLFAELGLEYPLLKRSFIQPRQILGVSLALETGLVLLCLPLLLVIMNVYYPESVREFVWLASIITIFSSVGFILKYFLLGTFNVINVFIINTISIAAKFVVAFTLVAYGFGTYGLLVSFLIQSIIIAGGYLLFSIRRYGIKLDRIKQFKELLHDGLINTPSKMARMLSLNLSIILLASMGISSSEIGSFYIAITISIAVGSFISSMAYMVIPTSVESKKNFSLVGLKYSIGLTAPLIAILIASPDLILSIIGDQYVSQASSLMILAIGILPFSVITTSISNFNYLKQSRRIIIVGTVQLSAFAISFFILVPMYGTIGNAISITIGFLTSAAVCLYWTERIGIKYVLTSILAVVIGCMFGRFALVFAENVVLSTFICFLVTTIMIVLLKNITVKDLKGIITSTIRNPG